MKIPLFPNKKPTSLRVPPRRYEFCFVDYEIFQPVVDGTPQPTPCFDYNLSFVGSQPGFHCSSVLFLYSSDQYDTEQFRCIILLFITLPLCLIALLYHTTLRLCPTRLCHTLPSLNIMLHCLSPASHNYSLLLLCYALLCFVLRFPYYALPYDSLTMLLRS